MKKFLIVKTGNTVNSLLESGEDFENWFVCGSGLAEGQVEVLPVHEGARLPQPDDYQGVLVTGSPAFVTDREDWSEATGEFLVAAITARIPILAICYGHQLLAHALGGTVGFHPQGREIGTVEVQLSDEGKQDPLLGNLPQCFSAQVSHSQTVVRLPAAAILLAGNAFEPHQAFRVGTSAWGLQFHPEFSARIVQAYISERREELVREGLDPGQLMSSVRPTREAASLLKRFVQLAIDGAPAV